MIHWGTLTKPPVRSSIPSFGIQSFKGYALLPDSHFMATVVQEPMENVIEMLGEATADCISNYSSATNCLGWSCTAQGAVVYSLEDFA